MKKTNKSFRFKSPIFKEQQTNFGFISEDIPEKKKLAGPFIKWAGGKTSLLKELLKRKPQKFKRYFEPFLGGGAFFFALQPDKAFLSDENSELINTYLAVKGNHKKLVKLLSAYKYESDFYYSVRNLDREKKYKKTDKMQKAARFIYLNKTCFNGLYRVNSKGEFNVPFGKYSNPGICDPENLQMCSKAMKKASLSCNSYEKILSKVKKGDFVYLDPPYMPVSKTANFTSYTKSGFSLKEQTSLSKFCEKLHKKGAYFMLSNSATEEIRKLYSKFYVETVKAPRAINSDGNKRGRVDEVIVRNYL